MIPYLAPFSFSFGIPDAIDIVATSVLIYYLLLLIRGTRAVQIVLGLLTLVIVLALSNLLHLLVLATVMQYLTLGTAVTLRSSFSRNCAARSNRSAAGASFTGLRPTRRPWQTSWSARSRPRRFAWRTRGWAR